MNGAEEENIFFYKIRLCINNRKNRATERVFFTLTKSFVVGYYL